MRTGVIAALLAVTLAGCTGEERKPAAPARAESATDVAEALKRAGLPVSDVVTVTKESDPDKLLGRPGQYVGKVVFRDARHPGGADAANTIEVFGSVADAMRRGEVVAQAADPGQRQMLQGKVYLRLGEAVTPAEAAEYRKAVLEQRIGL